MELTYILDENKKPIPCANMLEWGKWMHIFENNNTAKTNVGNFKISTVFLGISHGENSKGNLVLWETMLFSNDDQADEFHDYQRRYSSHKEALLGHEKAVKHVNNWIKKK